MRILLPPSEGKTAPVRGPTLDLTSLTYPGLADRRQAVIDDLITASAGGPSAIGAPATTTAQVHANTELLGNPCGPAADVYTGVLFAAARLAELTGCARQRSADHVRIASTVFGFVSPTDLIPVYRLPPAAKLPTVGAPIPYLAAGVADVMEPVGLVIDCRSGPYLRMWKPLPETEWVTVKVVEIRDGSPVVVSHFAKHTRGVFTHHLLARRKNLPRTAEEAAAAASELVGTVLAKVTLTPARGASVLELTLA